VTYVTCPTGRFFRKPAGFLFQKTEKPADCSENRPVFQFSEKPGGLSILRPARPAQSQGSTLSFLFSINSAAT
jgi:hypothetical protein